jgi:MFS family permease
VPAPKKSLFAQVLPDITPLRASREFRLLTLSGAVTMIGSFVVMVALPLQIWQLTGSYMAVGMMSLAEFVPMVVCGLWGGALADSLDRRAIILWCEAGLALSAAALTVNALLPEPRLWVLYVVGALNVGVGCLQRPSMESLIPQVVEHDQLSAAAVLTGLRWNVGAITVPAFGGWLVAAHGPAVAYGLDAACFLVSLVMLRRIGSHRPAEDAAPASLQSLLEGVRYAVGRKDLMGTYLVDIAAMLFAMSTALFPALAEQYGAESATGLLYSAGAVGSLIASLTGRWTARVHRQGMGVIVAAGVWGAAVGLAALIPGFWALFACLALAGAADMISGVFRSTIWNQTIPHEMRGRLAGIELLSYSSGPMLGNSRASLMAQLGGARFSLGAGGLLCVAAVAGLAAALPSFRRYDARTDEHAVAERARRAAAAGA